MRLKNILVIIKREYLTRIRSKGFWIGTIAIPLLMLVWVFVPTLVMSRTKAQQKLALVDATGKIAAPLSARLDEVAEKTEQQVSFTIEQIPYEGDPAELRKSLDEKVLNEEIQAWVWIDADSLARNRAEYHAESVSNFLTQQALESALSSSIRNVRLQEAGYDVEAVRELSRSIDLETVRITAEGSRAEGGFTGFVLAMGLFIVLYTTTLIYGQQVMNGILEEKTSRVVEVILAATRPAELMAGKLLGICMVGLTQLVIWVVTGLVMTAPGLVTALAFMPENLDLPTLEPILLVHFFLLFLLGFFFYGTLYAMIGASFNSMQEAQQVASVAVVFVVAPWLFFMPVINDPDSTVSVVTSLIPCFTPLLMMLRIAVKMPPLWQIVLGYALTIGLCAAMIWLCARIYRVGILMYGKKPTIQEIWRWVRYA